MDLFQSVDLYCERLDPSYWAEPLNAISNAAFLLGALWALWSWRACARNGKAKMADPLIWAALILASCIGLGSFLFHTHATLWAELTDVVPIWLFVAYFIFLAIYRIGGLPLGKSVRIYGISVVITVAIFALSSGATVSDGSGEMAAQAAGGDGLNGSSQYFPALGALFIFSVLMLWRKHPARYWISGAGLVFTLSLFFRTIDLWVCPNWAIGTHFLWHCFNGLMIGMLLQALVRHGSLPSETRSTG